MTLVMDDAERLIIISLRMKAARWLAGGLNDKGGVSPLSNNDVCKRPPLVDERVTFNRLQEAEQRKVALRRSEMAAYIKALNLPDDWFDGLYESAPGETTTVLGGLLRAVNEVGRASRLAREATRQTPDEKDRPGRAGGNAGG